MIKLERNFHPLCLSPNETARLTDIFKEKNISVWNFYELKSALLETSFGKCAYCECDLTKESKYMEVEHFRGKDTYPDDVMNWSNLLPACKRCNGTKGDHNVEEVPIINPYETNPREHFNFRLYRFRAKTNIGLETIGAFDLNNSDRAVMVRFEIGERLHEALIKARERLDAYKLNLSTRTKNLLIGTVKSILAECQCSSEYAATTATILHSDAEYSHIKNEIMKLGFWDQELLDLDASSILLKLDIG
ncbi:MULTISPECIES: HNH endonuclease [unclassified Pseudomonas]|uniref:HNH endonuclease n=1 Tax=unclassified Pseudomonas TaxID=196821 RepID=UPI00111C5946|nr:MULTISPECIES: HNH endonuclease [unclassified Pseudomonas]